MGDVCEVRGRSSRWRDGRLVSLWVLTMIWLCLPGDSVASGAYGGGAGTAGDPYLIHTAEQLLQITQNPDDWDKYFKLTADVDLGGVPGGAFSPIGYYASASDKRQFNGQFDGNGNEIHNFTYIAGESGAAGFFGYVRSGKILNLGLVNPEIRVEGAEHYCAGLLVGSLSSGTVQNCYVRGGRLTATEPGNWWSIGGVGGLIGENLSTVSGCYVQGIDVTGYEAVGGLVGGSVGTITDCSADGEVTGVSDVGGLVGGSWFDGEVSGCESSASVGGQSRVGGLIGDVLTGVVEGSCSSGDAGGDEEVGGLIGRNGGGVVKECYSTTWVSGGSRVGGLVGSNRASCGCSTGVPGEIINCFSRGRVSGSDCVGGLVGEHDMLASMMNCYSASVVSGSSDVGGIVGLTDGPSEDCYWDVERSTVSQMCGRALTGGTGCDDTHGKTTDEMKQPMTFVNWDFAGTWTIQPGVSYPELRVFSGGPVLRAPIVGNRNVSTTDIAQDSVRLWGFVLDDGGLPCQYRFRYAIEEGAWTYTDWTGSEQTAAFFSQVVEDLSMATEYIGSAQLKNAIGESGWSQQFSFTTLAGPMSLTITHSAGGYIAEPHEAVVQPDQVTTVTVRVQPDAGYQFAYWTGTAVDAGLVQDPESPEIEVLVDDEYTLHAQFVTIRRTIYVDDDGDHDPAPGDPTIGDPNEDGSGEHPFDTIQEAIDVAPGGATVIVRPGTFYETIRFEPRNVVVTSWEPNRPQTVCDTVIDANYQGTVVTFETGRDVNCVLDGFVLTRGRGEQAGAVLSVDSNPILSNCLVVGNRAAGGGAVYLQNSNILLHNCTIADNFGAADAALICRGSQVSVENSILWNNGSQSVVVEFGESAIVRFSDVQGGWPGGTNLHVDPCFASPGHWAEPLDPNLPTQPDDTDAVWVAGDYTLRSQVGRWDKSLGAWVRDDTTSDCIDAGDPDQPWLAELWPHGERINIGVFGATVLASLSPNPAGAAGDCNQDGAIDPKDLFLVGDTWLTDRALFPEDVNRDGIVNWIDFAYLGQSWRWIKD